MVKKAGRKASRRRAQNAFDIASRDLANSSDERGNFSQDLRQNGTIVNAQKGELDSEDEEMEDEELDSDEALGSSDEYDVLNSKFSQTLRDIKKKKSKGNGIATEELDDEEEGYTSIDESDLMPLSEVWDMDENSSSKRSGTRSHEDLQLQEDSSSEALGSDDSSDHSDSSDAALSEESEEDPFDEISADDDDLELKTVASRLENKAEKDRYRKLSKQPLGEENEYAIPPSSGGARALNLEDMMKAVDDPDALSRATLLKNKNTALAVPLPQRIQKRHERKAAYEISKDEVNKWKDVVQVNRQAEHLSFPMNSSVQHNEASMFVKSSDSPDGKLEQKVGELLKESNLADPLKESTFEGIATAKITPEEMKKRTAEVRLMRELMFREERKAKRIKKIKSKAYHRIKKKELLKNQELIDDLSEDEEARNVARAKERMSLKHKASSKWAQDMVKHGMAKDQDTREEIEEMLRQGDRLRSKVMGHESGSESEGGISDIEDDQQLVSNSDEAELRDDLGKTGVLNMAFMKNAEARRAENNRANLKKLRALENGQDLDYGEEAEDQTGANVNINSGRRFYTPGALKSEQSLKETEDLNPLEENDSLKDRLTKSHYKVKPEKKRQQGAKTPTAEIAENGNSNPWLDDSDNETMVQKSSTVKVVDANSGIGIKSAGKIDKHKLKQTQNKLRKKAEREDMLLDLDSSNKINIIDSSQKAGGGAVFEQQDLIAEAFAGDDVVDKFEQEKKRVAIDEDDKIEDQTLPGWGDWAGAGAAPPKRRKLKKIKGTVTKDKRRDRNLKNVIINEKVNKKNLKFQSSAVPFPFETREQYERSLRMPLGQEWTSRVAYQDAIKPRIMTKPGSVIDPLKAPFK
ncbi:LAMI_0E16050g1_1 [Lachancea mirantina]|uniref:LAMI_0E16050g1_1 n=1 Tax=Lachancea mirantina TaxID=1230905 RepID=A0A1G4JST9_9SACH|nr:LAMI_0E16050g1_1 [Lachancea mirantina]